MCMYVSISISVHAYILYLFLLVCLAVNANICFCLPGHVYVCFISLSAHAQSCLYQFSASLYMRMYAKKNSFSAHFVVSRGPYLLLTLSSSYSSSIYEYVHKHL